MTYRPNPNTAAPSAAVLTGTEGIGGTQNGRDVAIPLSAVASYVIALLSAVTPVQPPASGIYQRTADTGGAFNKGTAPIAFSVTATLGGAALNYRLRDAVAAGNPVLVPATQALAALASGQQVVTVPIPAGTNWYFIDWQAGTAGQWVLGTQRFAVGDVLAVAGQSLASFFLSVSGGSGFTDSSTTLASLGLAAPGASSELASYALNPGAAVQNTPPAWATPADGSFYNAAGATEYVSRMAALTGVAQGVAGHAIGGSTISQWAVGQAFNTTLKANLQAAGGAFRTFLWVQGHDDAKAGTTAAAYQAALGAIVADLASTFPKRAFKRVVMSIPSMTSTYSTTAAAVAAIRAGSKAYAAGDSNAAYVDALDVALNDGVHPTQAGYVTFADHVYRAAAGLAGFLPRGDAGPSITGGTRAQGSAVVSLAVTQAGGTGLVAVGTPANQFAVFNSGSTSSPLAVSSVALPDAAHINLTLSAAPADAQALDVWVRYPFDTAQAVTSGIYDNATDGDGIARGRQLAMPAAAVTVAAPVPGTAAADFTGLAGLAAWYRPSDSSTVTASGGSVSQVADISGNARHATRASNQPTLATAVLNNLPVLAFNGSGQAMEMDSLAAALAGTTGPHHIFAVVRVTGSPASSVYPAFLALQAASPAADYGDGLFAYTNGNSLSWGSARAAGGSQAYSDGTGNGNAAATSAWYIVEATWDGVGQTGVAVNGGTFNLSGTNTGAAGAVAYAKGRMGVRWNGSAEVRPWPGQMAELAMVSGAILSGAVRTGRLKYLNTRYALGIAGLS